MKQATHFSLQPGWRLLIADMGLNPGDVLALAGLPADLFARHNATISAPEYFSIWRALEQMLGEQNLALAIGQHVSVEAFDPPIFASLCSENLRVALQRLKIYKRLIGPMILNIAEERDAVKVSIDCYGYEGKLPESISMSELVFFAKLVRLATRENIMPLRVMVPTLPNEIEPYKAFFGCEIHQGRAAEIMFSRSDCERPFLTENVTMWQYFEPELQLRLSKLEREASVSQRVKSTLLELLPSGTSSMEAVADRLAMSKRTLQRKLNSEDENYQDVLKQTRQELAQHYLADSNLSPGEISFLLGFSDTNSFIRAYSSWTGVSPGQYRRSASVLN